MPGRELAHAVRLVVSTIQQLNDAGVECSALQALHTVARAMLLPGGWHALTGRAYARLAELLSPWEPFRHPDLPAGFAPAPRQGAAASGRADVVELALPMMLSLLRAHPAPSQLAAMVASFRAADSAGTGRVPKAQFRSCRLWCQFTPDEAAKVLLGKLPLAGGDSDEARRLAFFSSTWDDREADGEAVRDIVWTVWSDGSSLDYRRLALDLASDLRGWAGVDAPQPGDDASADASSAAGDAPASWVDCRASGAKLPSALGLFKAFTVTSALHGKPLFWGQPFDISSSRDHFLQLVQHDLEKGFAPDDVTAEDMMDELGSEMSVRLGDLLLAVSVAGGEESAIESWLVTHPYEIKDIYTCLAQHLYQ